ncbi:hypothetical protein F52700_12071 [Fusarium sp. NRRL 52700]|nr:hypothetical protein F52700_12071 [Fusarium sp. NRRL 52700]
MIKPALDHMPAEILADICRHLCSHCTNDRLSHYPQPNSLATPDAAILWEKPSARMTTGLLSLARTCQVLNNAATPYVYHDIDAKRWSEQEINEFLKDRRQLHKRSFIRRLTYELDPFPLYTLLYRMPNLQLLSLIDRGTFGQTLASKSQKLLDLRYLHLERSTSSGSTRDLSTLENLFEMAPNIKTLVINAGVLECKAKLCNSPNVPLANLTCLKLYNVSVNLRILKGLLDNCGPLQSFIYICQGEGSVTPSILPFALSKSSSNSLRYLECYWHSTHLASLESSLLHSLKMFERLETLVLGGTSDSIRLLGAGTSHAKELDPTSLTELLPASIVEVRIDSEHLHKDMYQPMLALCQAKQAGSFPKLRSFLQGNFDVSRVPYTLGDLSELFERYGVSFKQEATSVFPPAVTRSRLRLIFQVAGPLSPPVVTLTQESP